MLTYLARILYKDSLKTCTRTGKKSNVDKTGKVDGALKNSITQALIGNYFLNAINLLIN